MTLFLAFSLLALAAFIAPLCIPTTRAERIKIGVRL